MLRLQRREYFRLSTPIANPVKVNTIAWRSDGSALKLELPYRTSVVVGYWPDASHDQAELLERGSTLAECKISLPEEGLLTTSLCVRNKFEVTSRSRSYYVRVSCEYVGLYPSKSTMVQRYITGVERERKARLSGIA